MLLKNPLVIAQLKYRFPNVLHVLVINNIRNSLSNIFPVIYSVMENYMLSEVSNIEMIHVTSFSSNHSLQNSKRHPLQIIC